MKKTYEVYLEHHNSYAVIYEDAPEGGVVASVPSLPGCYSQGDTFEEAEKHIAEAINIYLETQ